MPSELATWSDPSAWAAAALGIGAAVLLLKAPARVRLSRAKHRSLAGHSRWSRRLARLLPYHTFGGDTFFAADGAPDEVATARREGFARLAQALVRRAPRTLAQGARLGGRLSDVNFTEAYRVPFPFRERAHAELRVGLFVDASDGARLRDLDGNWSYDLTGAYGVNLLGYDVYKQCIARAVERVGALGPVLGPYHPVVADNAARLCALSGMDEVSFHMSGTEAVMQAVRLARYHTRRTHLVRFCGAYHGWWDGVQPGVGNPRDVRDVYTLAEMSERTLRVLDTRRDIACVLVNPLQALHPNATAQGDAMLLGGGRRAHYDKSAYAAWLRRLRTVCTRRGIVLIFDEVFLGFRVAPGGVQEYFGVRADLVTYGKTLGGGLPVGVVCGRRDLMKRFRDDRPSDVCFARGTFNAHPYVMAAMNEFLRLLDTPAVRATYHELDRVWDERARELNRRLELARLPVRVENLTSVFTTVFTTPGMYHWMFQYYLRAQGLVLSWVGSGRFILSHSATDDDLDAIFGRFVAAARDMEADGWWWTDATLTPRSIRRRLLTHTLRALLRRPVQDGGATPELVASDVSPPGTPATAAPRATSSGRSTHP